MKKIIIVTGLFILTVSSMKAQGIRFEQVKTWREIQARAKAENKYIFVDAYTTWCGPCKAMSEETFPKKEVGDLMNRRFISVKVQMDRTKNDPDSIKLWYTTADEIGQRYKITAYPTVFFFSPQGKLVHRTVGYRDAPGLIAEARIALDTNQQYYTLLEKYQLHQLDTAALKKLVLQADAIGDKQKAREIAERFVSGLTNDDFYKKHNLLFTGRFLNGSQDKRFKLFLRETAKLNRITGEPNFAENAVMRIIEEEELMPYDKVDQPDWNNIERKIVAKYGALGQERVWAIRTVFYIKKKDWLNFGKYYRLYFQRALSKNRTFLLINNLSWFVVEHNNDRATLNSALAAMKYDLEKFEVDDPGAMDTYANLLYKAGRREEALQWEGKALKLSDNLKLFADTIEKMKRGEVIWK